jgi:hypothetical protein
MQDLTLGGHGDIAKQLSKLDAAALEGFSKKMQITGGVYGATSRCPRRCRAPAPVCESAPSLVAAGLLTKEQAAHPDLSLQTLRTGAAMSITAQQQAENEMKRREANKPIIAPAGTRWESIGHDRPAVYHRARKVRDQGGQGCDGQRAHHPD